MKTNNTARVERWVTLILVFGFVALTGSFVAVSPLAAQKKTKVDTPVMTCGTRISGGFMDLILCAPVGTGATGAPAGFSIQSDAARFQYSGMADRLQLSAGSIRQPDLWGVVL